MTLLRLIAIVSSSAIFIIIIELIRRNRLKERYAILWLAASIILLILSIWERLLDRIALFIGFYYPPSLLFLVGFVFLMLILLYFSVIISALSEENKRLAQEIGILKLTIKNKQKD